MVLYLDNNATSPMHPEVVEAILPFMHSPPSNPVDALGYSAHKLGGPGGIGDLVVKRKPRKLLISGGEQENKRRGGTKNVAGIVGLGKATELAGLEMEWRRHHLQWLTDVFEMLSSKLQELVNKLPAVFRQAAG